MRKTEKQRGGVVQEVTAASPSTIDCSAKALQQHNVVLLLPHGALRLKRNWLADEITETCQMLAFLIQKQFHHTG